MTRLVVFAGLSLAAANPMDRVIAEIQKVMSQNTADMKDLEVEFAGSQQDCSDTIANTADRIEGHKTQIEAINAKIETHAAAAAKAHEDADAAAETINKLQTDQTGYESEKKEHNANSTQEIQTLSELAARMSKLIPLCSSRPTLTSLPALARIWMLSCRSTLSNTNTKDLQIALSKCW